MGNTNPKTCNVKGEDAGDDISDFSKKVPKSKSDKTEKKTVKEKKPTKEEGKKNSKKKRKEAVKKKITDSPYYKQKYEGEIDNIAEMLSDKKKLMETYLSTNWLVTQKFHENVTSFIDSVEKVKEKSSILPESTVTEEEANSVPTMEELKIIQNIPDFQLKHEIKIKFIISEIIKFRERPLTKHLYFHVIAPFMTHIVRDFPEYGLYHLALVVGPWIIEYNSSGLCIPRKIVSTAALSVADLGSIGSKKDVEKTVEKLADVIVKWNTEIQYCKNTGNLKTTGNCQDFFFAVLEGLDMKLDIKGPFKKYVKRLMSDDAARLVFYATKEFKKKFGLAKKEYVFNTHKELDVFCNKLLLTDPDFHLHYKNELQLLKSFDRAFWMRHFKVPKHKGYFPLEEVKKDDDNFEYKECCCPFSDPRDSKSFIYVKSKKDPNKKKKKPVDKDGKVIQWN